MHGKDVNTVFCFSFLFPLKKDVRKNERDRKERYICRKGVKEDVSGSRKTVQEVFFSWGEGGGQMG